MSSGVARRNRKRARHQASEAIRDASNEELRNLRHELGRELNSRGAEVAEVRRRLEAVIYEIDRRKKGTAAGLVISDHAVLRYLERVKGIDMQEIREEIAEIAAMAETARGGPYGLRKHDGLVLGSDEEQNTITTVFRESELGIMEDTGWDNGGQKR